MNYVKKSWMGPVLCVLLMAIAILQLIMMIEFIDLQASVTKVIELNEDAAFDKREAAALGLKNERMRHTYLKVILDAQGLPDD